MRFDLQGGPLQLRVAILGNPCVYPAWDEDQMQGLVRAGFNAVQLNIAWGRRPNDEALNLRDIVTVPGEPESLRTTTRRAALHQRCALARQSGLRTLFHFGSPYMWRNPNDGKAACTPEERPNFFIEDEDPWFDVLNPCVVAHEVALLEAFRQEFPHVDDILVYTYDQDAWQASEFSRSKHSRGIPLHKRLPDYLHTLHDVWTRGREGQHMMWWEPWELSAGQIYACLPQIPRQDFGMMLHNNIAEVQVALPACVWYRNMGWLCAELGIPIVGEGFFCSMTEEVEPLLIPCPRLVDEEVQALTRTEAVVGIKEYFGVLPLEQDFNLDMLRERLADPGAETNVLLDRVVARFGDQAPLLRRMLERFSEAMRLFPWDASWFARETGMASVDHGWSAATIRGQMCETPSWESTRHAHFMMTDDRQPHPFMLEDIQLRCEAAASRLQEALTLDGELIQQVEPGRDREGLERIHRDGTYFLRVIQSYAFHLRETNVARLLREDLGAGRPLDSRLCAELSHLLEADAANQLQQGRVLEMKALFAQDPEAFIWTQLLPVETTILEKGHHTLTTR